MTIPQWIHQLFTTIDGRDAQQFVTFLTEDARFRFGNAPEVRGRVQIQEAVAGFFGTIQGLQHRIINTWIHPDTVICQGEVTYTRLDGSQLTLPFTNIFGLAGKHVAEYLIYMDITPLYAEVS